MKREALQLVGAGLALLLVCALIYSVVAQFADWPLPKDLELFILGVGLLVAALIGLLGARPKDAKGLLLTAVVFFVLFFLAIALLTAPGG